MKYKKPYFSGKIKPVHYLYIHLYTYVLGNYISGCIPTSSGLLTGLYFVSDSDLYFLKTYSLSPSPLQVLCRPAKFVLPVSVVEGGSVIFLRKARCGLITLICAILSWLVFFLSQVPRNKLLPLSSVNVSCTRGSVKQQLCFNNMSHCLCCLWDGTIIVDGI